jgi:hypothetical protein
MGRLRRHEHEFVASERHARLTILQRAMADGNPAEFVKGPPFRWHRKGRRVVALENENPPLGKLVIRWPIATFHRWNSRKERRRSVPGDLFVGRR